MALIKCPECGHEVSSEAKNCPNCGYPIAEKIDLDKTQGETVKKENEELKLPIAKMGFAP